MGLTEGLPNAESPSPWAPAWQTGAWEGSPGSQSDSVPAQLIQP